jgi:hypothetical protein
MEKLQKWAHVAEISGAVAVVVSLLYVGLQISKNTEAQLSETEKSLFTLGAEWDAWYQDLQFVAIVAKADEDLTSLTKVERLQFEKHVLMGLNLWAYALSSYERRHIDEEEWQAWNSFFSDELKKDAWLAIYRKSEHGYPQGFQSHLSTLIEIR